MLTIPDDLVAPLLRLTGRPRIWRDAAVMEAHVQALALRPRSFAPPRRLRRDVSVEASRDPAGWPLYTLAPLATRPRGTVIYAHGGGWVSEIAPTHFRFAARLAREAGCTVVLAIYPLIPWGTAQPVVDHVVELAAAAADQGPLVLAGDSAGGQIALSSAQVLRRSHGVRAARTVLISPGTDATLTNPEIPAYEAVDPWLGRPGIRVVAARWAGDLALDDPRVSPVYGRFDGLGPLSIYMGTRDLLCPDARRTAERAAAAGVDVDLQVIDGQIHVYPFLPTLAGRAAAARIVEQVRAAVQDA